MPSLSCHCQCKMCRVPGGRHCGVSPRCNGAPPRPAAAPPVYDEAGVEAALRYLKAGSGTHSPSVAEIERALPGLVSIDACFLSNPYATREVLARLRGLEHHAVERMVSHYPSQSSAIASVLSCSVGVAPEYLVAANGACEVIQALLAAAAGPVVLSIPTFSAYYEFARGPLVVHQLDSRRDFVLDLEQLEALATEHRAATVVIITPNNPDGGAVPEDALVAFLHRTRGRVEQVIVDESFAHFSTVGRPRTLAPLVPELPHLVVVNSMSKSHGIAGLRLGYAVMAPEKVRSMRRSLLWNLNAFAEWFCDLLADPGFGGAYERARRRYVRETQWLFAGLRALPGVNAYPSAANFGLLELDRPARQVAATLLARHGVYVRDCADKLGLDGERFLRVAARTESENRRILAALADVLSDSPPPAADEPVTAGIARAR